MTNATWRRSSKSNARFHCVEVALTSDSVAVRDSKNPDHDHLTITRGQWRSFLAAVQADRRKE